MLTYSEDFTNSIWPTSSRATLLTATGVDNPFGGTNASTWKNGGTAADELIHRVVTVTAGIPHTYSVWLRRRSGTGTINMYVGDNIPIDVTSQVTTEWKRISVTATPSTTTGRAYIAILGSGDEVDVWGAQVEAGTYAGDYAKTEGSAASTARTAAYLPDGNGNFVSAGDLLLEGSGTNLVLRSEDLTLSPWNSNFSGAGVTATNETYTAPDGSTTVTKLTFNQQYGVRQQDVNTSDGTSYTFSGYVKRLSGPTAYNFLHWNSASGNSTGGLTVTDQWTRFEITVLGKSGGGNIAFGIQTTATSDFGELFVWGVQVEANSYATSYIPTSGSTATRAADVSTSAATFGNSFYNQTEGTVFSDTFTPVDSISGLFNHDYTFHDGTNTESITIVSSGSYGSTGHQIAMSDGGSNQFADNDGTKGIFNKFAIGYKLNDTAASANSSTPSTDTSCTIPFVTKLSLGGSHASGNTKLTQLKRLTYWPSRLSNDTLQTITT